MDFYRIVERSTRNGVTEISPDFRVSRSQDLMVRGKSFYAIWDEEANLWSTDEYDVQRLVDAELVAYKEQAGPDRHLQIKLMADFSSNIWLQFRNYLAHVSDYAHQLDTKLTFSNTEVKKKDFVSRRLPYALEPGTYDAWDELIGTLYKPEERQKLEWAIGSIVAGDAKDIQKFVVLYGEAGSGKSTVLNIIQKLFAGYYTAFEAKALTTANNSFSTEVFRTNPLVAIQHDGDLSKIEDNTKLNSIISHEEMTMNEKYKPSYMARANCFLFMGTNKPVKITDAKSGIIRRLIDVKPSGNRLPPRKYQTLMSQIEFELGAIAAHCLEVYREMGKDYYSGYRPLEMMLQTDVFFNYIESIYDQLKAQDGISLAQAYELYKIYCDDSLVDFKLPRYKFREELKNYFEKFDEVKRCGDKQVRSYYSGFLKSKFRSAAKKEKEEHVYSLVMDQTESLLDEMLKKQPAQYSKADGTPKKYWTNNPKIGVGGKEYIPKPEQVVDTVLSDIDTSKEHYVKPPLNHIVVDFDLKDENGEKSAEKNIEAASKWPATYSEFSKSGHGVHLHYIYPGDIEEVSRVYDEGVEIKLFNGDSSLRRKLTLCNNIPVATIASGLPMKEKSVINFDAVKSERGLKDMIERNLRKEFHPGTKPSIDFIYKILDDAYKSGLTYDMTPLRPSVLIFANNSSNQAEYCVKLVSEMKFKSEEISEDKGGYKDEPLVFFDVEVFPNLFVVCWKYAGPGNVVVNMINPTAAEIEPLLAMKLVGYNCRRYDNHILYAAFLGYSLEQLYYLSQQLIGNSRNALFGEAYNLSYTDIYDFTSLKQSLKRYEIDLGIHHKELGLPWDQPVPDNMVDLVVEYCGNDVIATEATFDSRHEDFVARQILAELSGLTVNDTTQRHTAKIIFGNDKNPQDKFVYTHLDELFPGYTFDYGKSTYRGEITGEGGYVHGEEGMYTNVALLDVTSMHPTSLEVMNCFGPYTKNFSDIKSARIAIKNKQYDEAKKMLGGILVKYLTDESQAKALSYALKIVINIVYGLTSAKFDNPFRDPKNIDNIVAKRGALFMIDLKHAVQEQGFIVAHIKTDSIKIPDATPEIIKFVIEFGKKYGYDFEHEATYSKMCLVNDAVYIAKYATSEFCEDLYGYVPEACQKHGNEWTATGAQFAQPYVFKTLFSHEPLVFKDMCEVKAVTTSLYLDMNEEMSVTNDEHNFIFVGKIGSFVPIKPGYGGGLLMREKEGKYYAATGSKGYRWLEAEMVTLFGKENDVDRGYHDHLVDDAVSNMAKYGDVEWFLSN